MSIASMAQHASFILLLSSSLVCNSAHCQHQYVALYTTCIYVFMGELSKIISFLLVHMAQHKAVAPTKICFLLLSPIPSNQFVNKSLILVGRCIPKVFTRNQQNDNKKTDAGQFPHMYKNTLCIPGLVSSHEVVFCECNSFA